MPSIAEIGTALTTLGLLIGVAAVVAMLAIGEGASYEAQQRIKAMGSTNILISSKKPPGSSGLVDQINRGCLTGSILRNINA